MNSLMFGVRGQPVPKQSFRVRPGGGYIEPRVKAWQDTVQLIAQLAWNDQCPDWPLDQEYFVTLRFYLGDLIARDLDNLSKAVLDGMNKVIWDDDKQVIRLHLSKYQVEKEYTGVIIQVMCLLKPSKPGMFDSEEQSRNASSIVVTADTSKKSVAVIVKLPAPLK